MKKIPKKILIIPVVLLILITALVLVVDNIILPNYVFAPELEVPDITGMNKEDAIKKLDSLKLRPVIDGSRFDSKFEKDAVIFQRPRSGTSVKENRRIYMIVSGGDPKISMPQLIGKTYRDAKLTIERLGLVLGEVEKTRSEFPADRIVVQNEIAGAQMAIGDTVHLEVSVGPKVGKSRVPGLVGKSLKNGEALLKKYSLRLGKIEYMPSRTLLPNTIAQQYPSEGTLMEYGDSVDVYVYKSIK